MKDGPQIVTATLPDRFELKAREYVQTSAFCAGRDKLEQIACKAALVLNDFAICNSRPKLMFRHPFYRETMVGNRFENKCVFGMLNFRTTLETCAISSFAVAVMIRSIRSGSRAAPRPTLCGKTVAPKRLVCP